MNTVTSSLPAPSCNLSRRIPPTSSDALGRVRTVVAGIVGVFVVLISPVQAVAQRNGIGNVIPYTLEITGVEPATPIENQPIKVSFSLINWKAKALNARVAFDGRVDEVVGRSSVEISNLPSKATKTGRLTGLAPQSGHKVTIRIVIYDDADRHPGVEFVAPSGRAETEIDVSGRYELLVDLLHVLEARSPQKDTLVGEVTATYGGVAMPNPQPKYPSDRGVARPTQTAAFGDHGDDDKVEMSFAFGPFVSTPGSPETLDFSYVFVNAGYADSGEKEANEVMNAISTLGAAVASSQVPAGSGVWPQLNQFHHYLNGVFFADCDGLVAGDKITFTSENLAIQTVAQNGYREVRRYQGTTSKTGCGRNSLYEVRFRIVRRSAFGL